MPKKTSVLARALAAVGLVAGISVLHAPQASADDARPVFKMPFGCGQSWFARTYAGHPSHAVDWNLSGGGEADYGQPVLAGAPGIAIVETNSGYGNMVRIDHGGGWQTLYAHLSAVTVTTGKPVTADTVVGKVGSTGRSDGSHLHQEQSLNGVRQPVSFDGNVIAVSFSSRGASYVSTNCAPAPVVQKRWSAWACRFRCIGSPAESLRETVADDATPPTTVTRRIF